MLLNAPRAEERKSPNSATEEPLIVPFVKVWPASNEPSGPSISKAWSVWPPATITKLLSVPAHAWSVSIQSSPAFHTNALVTFTVPPKNSIPSSWLATISTFSITVPLPTPPSVRPLISLPSPMFAPPWRIETNFTTPELSAASEPP